jgi:hypothetical protein
MIVKFEINSFTGHADLTGGEVDVLTKVLAKFAGTDSRYTGSRYVDVLTGKKPGGTVTILVEAPEVVTPDVYEQEKATEDQRRMAAESAQAAEIGALALALRDDIDNEATRARIDQVLGEKYALLYWSERLDQNVHSGFEAIDGGVVFHAGENERLNRITIGFDGSFKRNRIGG